MVIRRDDRVSEVLARDEGLIEVFVEASSAFERLRNPAMRRVMSRLVTVEKAARIAGVDADDLVERLNRHLEGGSEGGGGAVDDHVGPAGGAAVTGPGAARPAVLDDVPREAVVDLDVRADLRSGREPFSRIMAARREVPPGGVLRLRAVFEPVPLYDVLRRQGFDHWTERLADDDWRVWFYRPGDPMADDSGPPPSPAGAPEGRAPGSVDDVPDARGAGTPPDVEPDDGGVRVLDVRGLEPPEPMVRTLEALETLDPGVTLVQLNVRVPRFLLPRLRERGFTWEIREQDGGPVRVFIRRADP